MRNRSVAHGVRVGATIALLLAAWVPARASVEDDLAAAAAAADQLSALTADLGSVKIPDGPLVLRRDPFTRYQDYMYLHLIGQDKEAAEGFYGLVTTNALEDPTLHRDAEWQLAESLSAIGNVVTAERNFQAVIAHTDHPFRSEAVRKLLDLYARTGEFDKFRALHQAEIVSGKVPANPLITYTLAKSFYVQGDLATAQTYFRDIPADAPEYSRGRYFLGVIAIKEGRVPDSDAFFGEAAAAAFDTSATRDAHDLALLARARLAYERGDFADAARFYSEIGGDSAYGADILYESAWSNIKQDHYDRALESIDLFLMAFPEHRYSGELRVVQGHLFMGCAQTPQKCPRPPLYEGGDIFDQALATYERLSADYSPVRERIAEIAASPQASREFFENVLAAGDDDAEPGIPPYALAMMRAEPTMAKGLELWRAVEAQRRDVEASERMIAEIDAVMSREGGLGAIGVVRFDAIAAQSGAISQLVAVADAEARWLKGIGARGAGALATDLAPLKSVGTAAAARRDAAGAVRGRVAEIAGRIEAQDAVVRGVEDQVAALAVKLTPDMSAVERMEVETELDTLNDTLEAERDKVRALRLEQTRAQVPSADMTNQPEPPGLTALREKMKAMRPGSQAAIGTRFDDLYARLDRVRTSSGETLARVDEFSKTEFGKLQDRFQSEVVEVGAERLELERLGAETDRVTADLARAGLDRMAAFFDDSVMKAEMGIIDVFWARKIELSDERERVQAERNNLVAELERRFELIRQKMEQ